jgi:tRNA1Val (adenine37-N6)-methyltransferase
MKLSKPFKFKQFTVEQDKSALKVNTDAVLLGALADFPKPGNILEIGTGTGVISLMLAQRFPEAKIQGVEIEEGAFSQTLGNFSNSPWADRLSVEHLAFQEFSPDRKYELIVSNPPYFSNHLKTTNQARNIALHAESLTFQELAKGVSEALAPQGCFYAILPERQMEELIGHLLQMDIYASDMIRVYDRPAAQTLRMVAGFGFNKAGKVNERELFIKNTSSAYSEEYADVLRDFLTIF